MEKITKEKAMSEFEIIDPDVMNFVGQPIKIVTDKDKKYLGEHHRVAKFECGIQGIDREEHTLYAQKDIGFFIKDFKSKDNDENVE